MTSTNERCPVHFGDCVLDSDHKGDHVPSFTTRPKVTDDEIRVGKELADKIEAGEFDD